ncbi:hypothetical protein [Vibrio bivalvicida]|uniref:Uncharacterized protein n=1 Tax=Vibrio bivalvicida TaxID=1276888 RepID=A0A177Y2X0_9VIBR|nr:hypothetical protein [Vibrio bivalvicida]OAJ95229.1 hypothetical protein APB76_08075 [Vibrio bivalvicida]
MRNLTWLTILLVFFSATKIYAKDVILSSVILESVSVINVPSLGHKAGNLEIKVFNGIADLQGLNCDPLYITTSNDGVGFNNMISVLLAAHAARKPVILGVTDNPAYNAFPGRCSLLFASIQM